MSFSHPFLSSSSIPHISPYHDSQILPSYLYRLTSYLSFLTPDGPSFYLLDIISGLLLLPHSFLFTYRQITVFYLYFILFPQSFSIVSTPLLISYFFLFLSAVYCPTLETVSLLVMESSALPRGRGVLTIAHLVTSIPH
jgi:hypothetical protein